MEILETLGIEWQFLLVTVIGFLLLVWILSKYAFGPIYRMLEERQNTIRRNLDEAEERRDEMLRLQQEYEDRLGQIEEEARNKVQAAVRDAQAARDEIVRKAQEESAALARRAEEDIARERQKAMVEVRDEIAELAVTATRQLLGRNLDSASHTQLINDAIASINANGANGNGRLSAPPAATVMTEDTQPPTGSTSAASSSAIKPNTGGSSGQATGNASL